MDTRVIIITGASSGIGREIALYYATNPKNRFNSIFFFEIMELFRI